MEFTNVEDLRCKCGKKIIKCFSSSDSENLYFKLHYDKSTIENEKANYVGLVCKKCSTQLYLEVGFKK